jgi:inosine-uridine nucleoside N-ribohydrolase
LTALGVLLVLGCGDQAPAGQVGAAAGGGSGGAATSAGSAATSAGSGGFGSAGSTAGHAGATTTAVGGSGGSGGLAGAGQSGSAGAGGAAPSAGPLKVFLDTDLLFDPGDISAVTFAHGLADLCEIELIGTTAVTTSSAASRALDAINTYFGRPDIPIGVLKGDSFLGGAGYSGPLNDLPATHYQTGAAPDATQVFRQVLAKQPDKSVAVVSIGPLRNLSNFLKSPPDADSPLSGKDLIKAKVKFLSAMGGVFVDIGAFGGPVTSEFNIQKDAPAAKNVVDGWPSPIMFSGFEIGWYTCPDYLAIQGDPQGPMGRVLGGGVDPTPCKDVVNKGNAYGRPGWDQTSLLYAARGLGTFWTGEMKGNVTIDASNGEDKWTATPDRQQGFLTNVGVNTNDGEGPNHAKLKDTLNKAMAEIEAGAGKLGACKAKK